MKHFSYRFYIIALLLCFAIKLSPAQTFDMHDIPSDRTTIGIGFDKPYFSEEITSSVSSGVYHLRGNIPINPTLNLFLDIPYIVASYEQTFFVWKIKYDNNGLGNIGAAFQIKPETIEPKMSIYTIGLVLPTSEKNAAPFGAFTSMYFLQQYLSNSMGFYFNYAYHNNNPEGIAYGLELGPNFIIPTKGTNSELELFAHYGIRGGYHLQDLFFNVEFLGIILVTTDVQDFSDRFSHSLTFGTQWKLPTLTPEIYYRVFVEEEERKTVHGILGLGVSLSLP